MNILTILGSVVKILCSEFQGAKYLFSSRKIFRCMLQELLLFSFYYSGVQDKRTKRRYCVGFHTAILCWKNQLVFYVFYYKLLCVVQSTNECKTENCFDLCLLATTTTIIIIDVMMIVNQILQEKKVKQKKKL